MNLRDLRRELAKAGIRGQLADRIVFEFEDHLASDPEVNLGEPAVLARQFADELGTSKARRAAIRAFVALAAAGIGLVVMFLTGGQLRGWIAYGRDHTMIVPWWYTAVIMVCVVTAQVALPAGGLALLRAYRLRRIPAISANEATILTRRAAVGLIAGAITRLSVRATPWGIAAALSVVIVLVTTAQGIAVDDPYDGAIRGVTDAIACLVGFALLGGFLGLRRRATEDAGLN